MLPDFPFVYDEYDMPMNTRALPSDRLIEVTASYREELDQKSLTLAGDHRYYCRAAPGTEPMQWEAIGYLLPILARHYPDRYTLQTVGNRLRWTNLLLGTDACLTMGDVASLPLVDHQGTPLPDPACRPLDWLARQVQEDLILISGDTARGTPMVAGNLCFGASWCLDDKLGKSFLGIHDEVPQFAARIGRPADLVMRRLKEERPIGRLNWSIATTTTRNMAPRLAHLTISSRRGITGANAGDRCFLRLEWQTLSRLPHTGGILFTIHTTIRPLVEVIADPERLRLLTGAIKGLPRPTLEYKGMAGYRDALVDYLEARCRAAAGNPPTTAARLWRSNDGQAEPSTAAPYERERPQDRGGRRTSLDTGEPAGTAPMPAYVWDEGDGEPFTFDPAHVLEGEPRAHIRWARRSKPDQPWYQAGRLFMVPCTVRMICEGFQTFLIEDGEAVVTIDDEESIRCGAGDVISLPRDSVSIWRITRPLRCFFTYSK
jgi:dimethylamine monooxygenase subunit A